MGFVDGAVRRGREQAKRMLELYKKTKRRLDKVRARHVILKGKKDMPNEDYIRKRLAEKHDKKLRDMEKMIDRDELDCANIEKRIKECEKEIKRIEEECSRVIGFGGGQ